MVTAIHEIDIQWGVSRDAAFPADESMQAWVGAALERLETRPVAVCVRMMGRDEIADLNLRYRNKAGPTNVLSFPGEDQVEADHALLGDIALCTDVINEEAGDQGKSLEAHTAHMLVHGILHLKGYDHEEPDEAREMEQLEIAILDAFGFANPYLDLSAAGDMDDE